MQREDRLRWEPLRESPSNSRDPVGSLQVLAAAFTARAEELKCLAALKVDGEASSSPRRNDRKTPLTQLRG